MKKMIIASTSTVYGSEYLEYLIPTLENFFKDVACILFIPYARPGGITYDAYTEIAAAAFKKIGKEVKGIHKFENCKSAGVPVNSAIREIVDEAIDKLKP